MTNFAPKAAALAFAALLGAAAPALAQSTLDAPTLDRSLPSANLRSAVGNWLYDSDGTLVGSVYAITDGDRTVIVQYGSYRTPGRHLVALPSTDLAVVDGRATLRTLTADALAARPSVN